MVKGLMTLTIFQEDVVVEVGRNNGQTNTPKGQQTDKRSKIIGGPRSSDRVIK